MGLKPAKDISVENLKQMQRVIALIFCLEILVGLLVGLLWSVLFPCGDTCGMVEELGPVLLFYSIAIPIVLFTFIALIVVSIRLKRKQKEIK